MKCIEEKCSNKVIPNRRGHLYCPVHSHTVYFDGTNTVVKCGDTILLTTPGNHNFATLKCSRCGRAYTSIGSSDKKGVFENGIQPAFWPRKDIEDRIDTKQ